MPPKNAELYTTVIDGEVITMAEDLRDLPEADLDDPEVKAMIQEHNQRILNLYGKLTHNELEYMYIRRQELSKQYTEKSIVELNRIALAEHRKEHGNPFEKEKNK